MDRQKTQTLSPETRAAKPIEGIFLKKMEWYKA
jgi:hypothetical protein